MRVTRKIVPLYLLISILLMAGVAKAEIPDWHKPIPCFGCHKETLGADYGDGECGNCHYYKLPAGGFNVPLLESEHNPKICRACHIGDTIANGSERDIFHNGHNAVKCDTCHVSNNSDNNSTTVIKIEGIEEKGFPCVSCHGNQIHSIHVKSLGKICSLCHGSWAKDKVYIGNAASLSQNASQQSSNLARFTIFEFLKSLFNAILGIKG